jgi:hypothetical protein
MSWHSPVFDLGRPLADHHHVRDLRRRFLFGEQVDGGLGVRGERAGDPEIGEHHPAAAVAALTAIEGDAQRHPGDGLEARWGVAAVHDHRRELALPAADGMFALAVWCRRRTRPTRPTPRRRQRERGDQ